MKQLFIISAISSSSLIVLFSSSNVIFEELDPHFSHIRTEYGAILHISLYSVRMPENEGKVQTRISPNTDTFTQ